MIIFHNQRQSSSIGPITPQTELLMFGFVNRETKHLVVLVLLILHLFIVSCVDAGKVVLMDPNSITRSFDDMEADFSPSVNVTVETGVLHVAEPLDACQNLKNKPEQRPNGTSPFVLIVRGGCSFEHKVRNAQRSGFKAAIVHDNVDRDILLAMEGDGDGITIQAVFATKAAGETLKKYAGFEGTRVMLVPGLEDPVWTLSATMLLIYSLAMFVVLSTCVFVYRQCTSDSNATFQFHGMSQRMVKAMPSVAFTGVHEDNTTASSCAICLEDYIVGDKLRVLPCHHKFHAACVDSWLTSWRTFCPVCKRDARTSTDEPPASESTPLLRSSLVLIDPPLVEASSLSFSPGHMSSSYIQQSFSSSSINISRISEDFREQASPLQQSSFTGRIDSLHSPGYSTISPLNAIGMPPYRPSPSNASPGLVQSTNHRFNSLHCLESVSSLTHFASAHSLRYC
ncbi:unnamed protein product [Thlaspi arvense]|uniref:RING-type domain-containing protein n=1 Tax=Thlaspi arvense TaxID=13288 RepID=A0AAU9R487_THLAR|nr:unnamed protein product [Thlaspi arvense]